MLAFPIVIPVSLIIVLGIVKEPTVWCFITSQYPGIHGLACLVKGALRLICDDFSAQVAANPGAGLVVGLCMCTLAYVIAKTTTWRPR